MQKQQSRPSGGKIHHMNEKFIISRRKVLGLGVALAGLCAGCAVLPTGGNSTESTAASAETSQSIEKAPATDINSVHLRDNAELYNVYDDSGIVTMYLTVSRGNDSENTNHSWAEINHYSAYDYEAMGVPRYQVAALLQIGDENGPVAGEVGYADSVPNATVQIRGQSSSKGAQKNYKIKLKKNKGSWRGQRTIALNKHMSEGLRFRNKMAYDLIKGIDQMMGLRTQFVHLYVKDLTDNVNGVFEDYGLYTQVEQLNKTALKAHSLNPEAQLYKVNFFEFYRYEDSIKLTSDPTYDQSMFEYYLEIKGDSDHTKLIQMLEDLNDDSQSMELILEKYFDVENIAYWMAFQILTGNTDTQSRNMYLYSPQNSDTWYILDWDNDGMLFRTENNVKQRNMDVGWEYGISNYWGNVLFRRCLQTEGYRNALTTAIEDLHQYMNADRIHEMVAHYRTITEQFIWNVPDALYLPVTKAQYDTIAAALPDEIEENYQQYPDGYNYPMPFYISTPVAENGVLKFSWDASYSFDAADIYYIVDVARDYKFSNRIFRQENIILPEAQMSLPAAGQYFIRVRAINTVGYIQPAFDYYRTELGKVYGVKCFYVQSDGSVVEDVYEND